MAKGGRRLHTGSKPKPKAIKLLEGTFRADRDAGTPVVGGGWPTAPGHLNARELALWTSLEAECATWVLPSDWPALNGVVSLIDRVLRVQEAQQATPEAGGPLAFKHVVMTPNEDQAQKGIQAVEVVEAKENPLLTLELKLWRELRAFIGIVGLSPVDRARVRTHELEAKPANPLQRFLQRK